jgi:HEAT repeat protein
LSVLTKALKNTSPDVRVAAVYGYGEILADPTTRARGVPQELREQVIQAVLDPDLAVRDAAADVLRRESRFTGSA